ncbi:MAG: Zn-dependent exopeptidase M28 [Oscillospiraceae bacterium]|jgi:hypothetical protein|nr:Zn-dependent exopeptidase M28 [Oscillospiraceae bacterium]
MTARERISGYESKVREYTNFAVRGIKKVIKATGPRPCGSEAEHKAQQMMAKELEDCCESVRLEEFKVAPKAFLSWIRIDILLTAVSVIAYNLGYAWVSVALLALALTAAALEFLFYKQALDFMYRKKTSHNLVAVRKPAGEPTRRLILCAHSDSAPEWRMTYLGDKYFKSVKLLIVIVAASVVAMVFDFAAALAALLANEGSFGVYGLERRDKIFIVLGYVMAGLLLPLIPAWFFKNEKRYVDGANDNLSGCFVAMAVPKLLEGTGTRLEHTELVVICSGGEEAGLRGAKALLKAHKEELDDGVETAFIALDTLTDFQYMGIFARDMTNTVRHDPAVCAMMRKAANTAGHDVPYENLFFGASDAAAATQAGLRAAAFAAMDPAPAAYYHTRLDTVKKLQPKTIEASLDIVMEIVCQFDETGLTPFEDSKVAAMKH